MKLKNFKALPVVALVIASLFNFNGAVYAAWIVPQLPSNNLLVNPWFTDGDKPTLNGWTDATPDGHWGPSDKDGNPTPYTNIIGTSARLSVGEDGLAKTIDPGKDAYLYQVVKADPTQKTISFDMYWVAHTVDAQVNVYGSNGQNGPWTKVWTPFDQELTKPFKPTQNTGNNNQWLWQYYSDTTNLKSTAISQGYEYYKVEVHAVLPDMQGGFKITGLYFSVGNSPVDPTEPVDPVDPVDPIDPAPVDPRQNPNDTPREERTKRERPTKNEENTTNREEQPVNNTLDQQRITKYSARIRHLQEVLNR